MAKAAASASITAHYIRQPLDAVGYELMSLNSTVSFDQGGNPSHEYVSVSAFRRSGHTRTALPVNNAPGAEFNVFFRRCLASGSEAPPVMATSQKTSMVKSAPWARFDLVSKSDTTLRTVGGVAVYSYPDSAVLATEKVTVTHDGVDGTGGAITSIAFTRSATQPDTPSGGTYEDPVPVSPKGWSDAPPSGTLPLWLSRARFLPDTSNPEWSVPSPVEDSTGIEYLFSGSVSDPGQPDGTHPYPDVPGAIWNKKAEGAVWMAVALKNNGVWEPWAYTRIKGEGGADGRDAYSVDLSPESVTFVKGKAQSVSVYVTSTRGNEAVSCSKTFLNGLVMPGLMATSPSSAGGPAYELLYTGDGFPVGSIEVDITPAGGPVFRRVIQVSTVSDGKPGADGPVGPVTSVTRWVVNRAYSDGSEPDGSGVRVLNIVYQESAVGRRTYYLCLSPHTSSLADEPGSGPSWNTRWSKLNDPGGIFTEFLLATNARIDLLDSQEIILWHTGPGGTPVMDARIGPPTDGNARTIAWFGGDTPDSAKTWVSEDGTFHTRKAVIEGDVVFGGRVKPLVTRITSANYRDYRVDYAAESGHPELGPMWLLDFRKLTGCVFLDSSLNGVASSELSLGFVIGSKFPGSDANVENLEDYIGERIRVVNETSRQAGVTGYVTESGDEWHSMSPILEPGCEIHLRCAIRKTEGKKTIGWVVEYHGLK